MNRVSRRILEFATAAALLVAALPLHAQFSSVLLPESADRTAHICFSQNCGWRFISTTPFDGKRMPTQADVVLGYEPPTLNSASRLFPGRTSREHPAGDGNRSAYYKNKLEFSLEGGWLPINIPFPFDFLLGGGYNVTGLNYTLVPINATVRWQFDDVGGWWILRGNWDVTAGATATWIPRGPETRYFAYIMGIRRNFVPRKGRVSPYLDGGLGMGGIDAKGPYGVQYAQGQDFTFTLNLGSGVRYNFSPRYALEGGMHYMHISNLYLSQPKFLNYGINVYGPWIGINIRVGKREHATE